MPCFGGAGEREEGRYFAAVGGVFVGVLQGGVPRYLGGATGWVGWHFWIGYFVKRNIGRYFGGL